MALTTGKREVGATASSVANRMGVVPAYAGDPVSTIAKVATEKLDFFAKRQATLEEAKYKADLDLTTSKFINEKSREFFDSPDKFTKATDQYLNTLVAEAPERYKSWTKSMISGKALRKGEQIFNTRIKLDHIEATESIKARLVMHNETTVNDMFNISEIGTGDPDDMKKQSLDLKISSYHKDVWLPAVSEIYKDHLAVYNAAYPEDRASMIEPKEFLRLLQVSFEQAKVNTIIKDQIDTAMYEHSITNGDYQIGNDILKKLNLSINTMLNKEYMKNPQISMVGGEATLVNTTKNEREAIVTNAQNFMKGHLETFSQQLGKYESEKNIAITERLNNNLDGFIKTPENFTNISPNQLEKDMIDLNLNDEQKINYRKTYNGGQLILNKINKDLQGYIGDSNGMKMDTFSNELFVTLDRKGYAEAMGINTPADLKNLVIQQHMKTIFGVDDIRDTFLGTEPLFTLDANGNTVLDEKAEAISNIKFNKMVSYAKMIGEPIPQVTSFFNDIMNINVKSESDLMKLDNAAYMVNYFSDTSGFEFMFKGLDNDVKANILKLKEYHKLRHADFDRVTRLEVAQSFFEGLKKPEDTKSGQIKLAMDNFINYGGEGEDSADQIDLTSMVNKYIEDYQNERMAFTPVGMIPWKIYTSLATGKTTKIRGDGVIDSVEVDANQVRKAIRPYLDIYLTNMFIDESYVTKESVEKNLKNAMKFIMEDFANDGFNWKVFSGSSSND
jgi:hypothetical protein